MIYLDFIIMVALFSPIFIHKSLAIKIIYIISVYPLLVLCLYKNGIPMPGILGLSRNDFPDNVIQYAFISYAIGLLIFNMILYPLRHEIYKFIPIKVNSTTRFLLFIATCISCIPVLNIHKEGDLLRSATFYLFFNIILAATTKKRDLIWVGQLFICSFLLANGERVDSILLVVFLVIFKFGKQNEEIMNRKILYLFFIFFFIILVGIGYWRGGSTLNQEQLLSAIYSQQTVTDVVYIYLTGVNYIFDHGTNITVLYNLIGGIVPGPTSGVSSTYYYSNLLRNYMSNPGGGLFITEGMISMAFLGPILYYAIYAFLIKKTFTAGKGLRNLLFILIFAMQCRIIWYGFIYTYKPILMIALFYWLIIEKKKNKQTGNSFIKYQ